MKTKRAAIYTRVSTGEQSTHAQEEELKAFASMRKWDVVRIYSDKGISGASENRPELTELLRDCRRGKFDVVLVWKFDRFARSLKQLVTSLEIFKALGVDFVSATEAVDTSLPSGELVFQIFGAIAQFERSLIGERVRIGISEARRRGKRIGRPPRGVLSPGQIADIRKGHRNGASLRSLASLYSVSLWAVYQACRKDPR